VLGFIKQEYKIIEDNLAAAIRIDYEYVTLILL